LNNENTIALYRPGALGDIMMTLNCCKKLKKQYPEIHYFCHTSYKNIIENFVKNNDIVTEIYDLAQFNHLNYKNWVRLVGYPIKEGYPMTPMKKHLVEYFFDELKLKCSFDDFELTTGEIPEKIGRKNYPYFITVQTNAGWSIYKEWSGWQELINKIKKERPDISIYQIGGAKDKKLDDIDGDFLGDSFETNLAAQAWSLCHLGIDSVFNHTSNIFWRNINKKTKSIILFGSTQASASGYKHNINITKNIHCQPCFKENPWISQNTKGICENPPNQTYQNPKHECMAKIQVEDVYSLLLEII
jgi:hypothetical protein